MINNVSVSNLKILLEGYDAENTSFPSQNVKYYPAATRVR